MELRQWYLEPLIILDQINEFNSDPKREEMLSGERYYRNENDICNRQMFFYNRNKERVLDRTKVNNTVPHAYMKLQVDEKAGYFLGKPPNITTEGESDDFQGKLISLFDERFDDALHDVVVETSNKGIAWLYCYIDSDGGLRFEVMPSEQIIPIWADRARSRLDGVINYYYVSDSNIYTGEEAETLKVECWSADGVYFYVEHNGELVEDISRMFPNGESDLPYSGLPHFEINGHAGTWGMVPFIPFKNNSQELPDLRFIKKLIDTYDLTVSDAANTLEEIRQLTVVLKGYPASDLAEFMANLKYYGAIKVDEDGGVDKLDLSYDVTMQEKHLERVKRDLYQFGQSVNMDTDRLGQSPSGVALEFLYSGLKLKTDSLERKFKSSFVDLFRLACVYLSATGQGEYDHTLARVTFQRSTITNAIDQIDAVEKSSYLISKKTAISHHPWVEDVDQELLDIESEDNISIDQIELFDLSDGE